MPPADAAQRARPDERGRPMRLRAGLSLAMAYVAVLAVAAFAVPLVIGQRARVDTEVRSQASSQAVVVAAGAADLLAPSTRPALRSLAASAARSVRGRVLVVDERGRVIADSASPRTGEPYGDRPEVAAALRGRTRQERRRSDTLGTELLATAVPIVVRGKAAGAVRVTQSVDALRRATRRSALGIVAIAAAVLALGMAAALFVARAVAQPITRLEATARAVASGDLGRRAPVEGSAEQRSLARSFNAMTERLGTLLAARERFVADASHQLRTPLTGVRLRLEEARAGRVDAATAAELDAGLAEVDRLARIVGRLLDAEARRGDVATDLDDAVRRAATRWGPAAARDGARLSVSTNGAAHALIGSESADRILDALVENALRYGGAGTVELTARHGHLQVRDHGPGLRAGEEQAVLGRFSRGSAARDDDDGTGLGLAIARELATAAGGSLSLRNADGGGALASVTLPEAEA